MMFDNMIPGWFLLLSLGCLCPQHVTPKLVLYPPRVLLPYNYGLPSNITVSVIGGIHCSFEWKSSNPNVVAVDPICVSEDCCGEAVVSVVSSSSLRISTKVIAVAKGHSENRILECDVVTDTPTSIELNTFNEGLYLNGEPAVVTAVAKDKFNNVFNSINGLNFQWTATIETNPNDNNVEDGREKLEPESLLEALPNHSKYNSGLEHRGLLGHTVLLIPKGLGLHSIRVSLKRRDLLDLISPMAYVFVHLPVHVRPSDEINLIEFAIVDITVEREKGDKVGILTFQRHSFDDNLVYQVDSYKESGLYLENDTIKATGIGAGFGYFKITIPNQLNDQHLSSKEHELLGRIQVVKPAKLGFRISKGDFNTLEEMQIYVVSVEIFDEDGKVIYPSENLRIITTFPSSLFYVNSTTSNGTYHVVQALVPGKGTLKAEFKGVLKSDNTLFKNYDLSTSLEVTICQKLEISPKFLLLPKTSNSLPLHKIRLMATGGTGNYIWSTDTSKEIASINFNDEISHAGDLNIYNESDFNVILSDSNNPNFLTKSLVSVQNILDIEVYPSVVESVVGNVLILPVAFLAYEDKDKKIVRKFDDCTTLKPTVEIIEKHLLSLIDEGPYVPAFGKGCMTLQFKCKAPGYSRVNIYYESKIGQDVITHKTTTVLACFKSLKPVHPVRVAVLPLGGTKEIAFEGGPRKWPLFKDGHYTKLEASRPEIIDFEIIKDPIRYNRDLTVFRVVCKELGENILTFKIGNEASATNPHPAKEETTVKFICSEPHSIHLKLPQKKKNDLLEDNIVKVPFYGEKLFSLDIWIKDEMGRKLSNISSLKVEFENLDKILIEDMGSIKLHSYENAVAGYRKITRDYVEFKMTGNTGDLRLTAKVKNYKAAVLKKLGIPKPKREFEEITATIDLKLVSLRDINAGLYMKEEGNNVAQSEEGTCDEDSCKS